MNALFSVVLLKINLLTYLLTNKPIVLISHPSKLLLNVLEKILEVFLIPELPIEQAGFRRGGGTRDHIAIIRWMMERAREHQQYLCFIDFKKVFDCVARSRGNVDYLRDGGTYTSGSIIEKYVRKPESWRQSKQIDGRVSHRERCATGLHRVSFVIQHLLTFSPIRIYTA